MKWLHSHYQRPKDPTRPSGNDHWFPPHSFMVRRLMPHRTQLLLKNGQDIFPLNQLHLICLGISLPEGSANQSLRPNLTWHPFQIQALLEQSYSHMLMCCVGLLSLLQRSNIPQGLKYFTIFLFWEKLIPLHCYIMRIITFTQNYLTSVHKKFPQCGSNTNFCLGLWY